MVPHKITCRIKGSSARHWISLADKRCPIYSQVKDEAMKASDESSDAHTSVRSTPFLPSPSGGASSARRKRALPVATQKGRKYHQIIYMDLWCPIRISATASFAISIYGHFVLKKEELNCKEHGRPRLKTARHLAAQREPKEIMAPSSCRK